MYSFRQRSDTTVVDEPLYGHYLSTVDALHPGEAEILASMEQDGQKAVDSMFKDYPSEITFFKNMAHHLVGLDSSFLAELDNIILTRHPRDMLSSLTKQLKTPVLRDTGLKECVALLDMLLKAGQTPIVLESQEVLKNPEQVLSKLCKQLNIPFEKSMLSWQAGPKPEDGIWAKHWYDNVHKSTGFMPYKEKNEPLDKRYEPLLEECLPLYERLASYAIKAT